MDIRFNLTLHSLVNVSTCSSLQSLFTFVAHQVLVVLALSFRIDSDLASEFTCSQFHRPYQACTPNRVFKGSMQGTQKDTHKSLRIFYLVSIEKQQQSLVTNITSQALIRTGCQSLKELIVYQLQSLTNSHQTIVLLVLQPIKEGASPPAPSS